MLTNPDTGAVICDRCEADLSGLAPVDDGGGSVYCADCTISEIRVHAAEAEAIAELAEATRPIRDRLPEDSLLRQELAAWIVELEAGRDPGIAFEDVYGAELWRNY